MLFFSASQVIKKVQLKTGYQLKNVDNTVKWTLLCTVTLFGGANWAPSIKILIVHILCVYNLLHSNR